MKYCTLFYSMLRPMYVTQMGWSRMGTEARRRWARALKAAAEDTIHRCDLYLVVTDPDTKWVPLDEWKP